MRAITEEVKDDRKVMMPLGRAELEKLGYIIPQEDDRTKEEKISDYASTRDRDEQGRFLSKKEREQEDLEDYYYKYKMVFRADPDAPHRLVRHEELYWHQKLRVYMGVGFGGLLLYTVVISFWRW